MIFIFVTLFILLCLYPIIYVVSTSVSESSEVLNQGSVFLLPRGFSLDAYRMIFQNSNIPTYYLNSIIYAAASTLFMLFVTSMAGYALAIRSFFARKPITILMTITMFFSGGLIPYYLVIKSLGLVDTRMVMIIPFGINVWNIIIFRSFFRQHPVELRESAYIDGANDIHILFRIVLPVSKPLLATFTIFGVVASWNDYFTAMIFMNTEAKMPIQMLLRRILVVQEMQEEMRRFQRILGPEAFPDVRVLKSAVTTVTIIPILCVYPFLQKYFARGILIGSLKG